MTGAATLMCIGENDQLLGSFYAQPTGSKMYLGMLAIDSEKQARGVGKFLLKAAEDYGRQHGCTVSKMTVISVRNELLA